jgi:hypothetical protein
MKFLPGQPDGGRREEQSQRLHVTTRLGAAAGGLLQGAKLWVLASADDIGELLTSTAGH